ncbi:hypothetical protein [Zobellia galactanivorans]|uniref:Hypothetical membrane protein n=1 Tax=Zobellia galactanivorans (strain DSM 12802 / CCUG 47099 / CIP 106680 / NCIMB 13871 / Dsij) TaxID=63186 RepID=G0LC18_ZOBGA|nr:hypothetical protein [Zobellia galactanivorans]CAZ96575.1 Hypothetical membrane protein [Zobellia galactanivorans]
MKAKYFALVFLSVSILNSCKKEEDEILVLEGAWSGQYAGNVDSGNWSIQIDANKTAIGTFTSIQSSNSYQVIGVVSENGVSNATIGTSEVVGDFNGNLANEIGSGLWTNNKEEDSGSWTGIKL